MALRSRKKDDQPVHVLRDAKSVDDMTDEEVLAFEPEPPGHKIVAPPMLIDWFCFCVRFVAAWTYLFFSVSIVWVAFICLGWTHPILRYFGVPNRYLPIDLATTFCFYSSLPMGGMRVSVKGTENVDHTQGMVLMSNHTSGLDSFAIMGYSPTSVKFIMKKELLYINPFIFGLAWLVGHVPIDRSDRTKAIESINQAAATIKRAKRTVAIYPEGTRSKTGRIQAFKKGGFHLALNADVPIIPMVVSGTGYVWSPHEWFPLPATMQLRFLPKINVEKGMTFDQLLVKVRRAIIKGIQEDTFESELVQPLYSTGPSFVWLGFLYLVYCYFF